jgi:cysteine desulfurase
MIGGRIMSEKKVVYADHAATTAVTERVMAAMEPYFREYWGNPSSLHLLGRKAAAAVRDAGKSIADTLGCYESEIYFTSGGTEAINWAIKGNARANRHRGRHIVSTEIEHHAVLNSAAALKSEGYEATLVKPRGDGLISPDDFERAVRPDTIQMSCMLANNEIGTIEPVSELARISHRHKADFFCDAVQAMGNIPIDIDTLGADMLAISGHKIGAPKGIGLLYVRTGCMVSRYIDGGAQQRGHRAGTENVPYIVGLSQAIKDAAAASTDKSRLKQKRDRLASELLKIPFSRINGTMRQRLAGNLNMSFEFCESESLLLLLDLVGICVSAGSACMAGNDEPSHVLKAIGLPENIIRSSLRFSIGDENTDDDIDYIITQMNKVTAQIRALSPEYGKLTF